MLIEGLAPSPQATGIQRLYLFDIDGTLITSGGAGEASLKEAVHDFCGKEVDFTAVTFAGNTDTGIARHLLRAAEMELSEENIMGLLTCYLLHLAKRISLHNGQLLSGIIPLLEKMRERPDCVLALLTGNLVAGAKVKLSHYGVWHYFGFGAFADDHHERNKLGPVAMARALERHGKEFPPERIYVIGDTPRDIECGKIFGAKTVAVATGHSSREELARHKPDFLFDDLSDADAVLSAIAPLY
jgi:phosphoglycolate phosphatase-like HAD superfamily hydrolase